MRNNNAISESFCHVDGFRYFIVEKKLGWPCNRTCASWFVANRINHSAKWMPILSLQVEFEIYKSGPCLSKTSREQPKPAPRSRHKNLNAGPGFSVSCRKLKNANFQKISVPEKNQKGAL